LEFDPAAFEDLAWWVEQDRAQALRVIRLIRLADAGRDGSIKNIDQPLGYDPSTPAALLDQKLKEEILGDLIIANNCPTIEGLLRHVDVSQNLGSAPSLGVVIVCCMPLLLKLHEGVGNPLQVSDVGIVWIGKVLVVRLFACLIHRRMVERSRQGTPLPCCSPIGNGGRRQKVK
jgi:hypothetical protein